MREMTPSLAPDEVRASRRPISDRPATPGTGLRKGPGPSKLSYRLERTWAKPAVRNLGLVYLPLVVLALIGWRVAADDGMRGSIEEKLTAVWAGIVARPEFAVRGVSVTGTTEAVEASVREAIGVVSGMSSLTLDVEDLRSRIESLGPVESATVQFDPQGTLRVAVVQRIEAALYRRPDGVLVLLDRGGVEIGPAGGRVRHPDLPVVLGEGAPQHVAEALDLLGAAPEIGPRLRAAVRVGERRWDLVLDRGLTIKLPGEAPLDALARVMALHYGEELLDRGLAEIDMRLPGRPALRMTPEAAETYQIRRAVGAIGGRET
jgi:cell division protein FtsQ